MGTPSEEVTESIVRILKDKQLFLPDDSDRLKAKIATGTMKTEDWLLAAQKAADKGADQ